MKILFSLGNFGFLRNFEPALRLLAARGHDIHLVAERRDSVGGTKTLDLLLRDHPDRIRYSYAPSRKDAFWLPLSTQLRLTLDYWRYLHPRYDQSPSLRARGASQAPRLASTIARMPLVGSASGLAALGRLVRTIERGVPHGDAVESFLRAEKPDILLLTPLLYFGSQQVEYVRAARALGIRTVLGVGSWDHLTTKGLIHERPDRVMVWNDAQRVEAGALHGIPAADVTVTGAQAYDHWFVSTPSLSREAFCRKVGLPDDRPLLLYLCSSPFITPHEVGFVRRWIESIRTAPAAELRRAAILIRPHPQNAQQWQEFDPAAFDAVGIWPRAGANPVDTEARADYYDSMFHSVAVVGVNTSALIESGIVGRPVYTVLAGEFAGQQEGTLHFQHLKNVNGGLLTVAATLDEHVAQLADAVRRVPGPDPRSRAFIESFVRPHGVGVPAASYFVDALEAQAAAPPPARRHASAWSELLRPVLAPLALAARAAARRRRARRQDDPDQAAPGRPLKLLFAVASPEYIRYFDSTMTLLLDRGHEVSIGVNWLRERKHARLEGLDDPRITILGLIPKRMDVWTPMARAVRGTFDFVRYLHPRLAEAPALRARMKRKVLPSWMAWLDRIHSVDDRRLARIFGILAHLERAIPVSRALTRFLSAHRPDAVIVSPLVDAASDQVDLVRAAQALGIPAIAGIASWDNLTNKGHLRVQPDLVTVWNAHQKAEAITYHGVEADRVAVTGAQLFDRWFVREPSQSREAFCAMVGLPADRPIVLYTGSSVFIARSEVEAPFARAWIAALRASGDSILANAAILIRPHPFNCEGWLATDFSDLGPVAVFPGGRYTPSAESARASLFDSLYYTSAVVGVNTSAMVEAAILRKPVLSLLAPEFADTQEGTLHFHYLLPENGGFLRVAQSIPQHVEQLAEVMRAPDAAREQTSRFVESFLRPNGLDVPCTPLLADALERRASQPRSVERETIAIRVTRVAVWPLAWVLHWMALGGSAGTRTKRAAHEAWSGLGKTTRAMLKRLVIRPARGIVWVMRRLLALLRRVARRLLYWTLTMPKRLLRLFRHLRYHVAVRLRGDGHA
ncbi:MAG: hypothetical protein ABL993_09905 [Vicinamibacterales bacterium]